MMTAGRSRFPGWQTILLAVSAVIPLFGALNTPADLNLLIYTLFVLGYLLRGRLAPLIARLPPLLTFVVICWGTGLLSESLVWVSNMNSGQTQFMDFFTDYGDHIRNWVPFYLLVAAIWGICLRSFRFSILEVFLTAGLLFGVLIEQRGAIFMQGLAAMPAGLLLWLYVMVVYGSYPALAYALTEAGFDRRQRRKTRWKIVAVVAMLFGVMLVVGLLTG
jgi:hypothetical protein